MGKNNTNIFWIPCLSIFVIWKILSLGKSGRNVEIRFMKKTFLGHLALHLLSSLRILQLKVSKIEFSMGDMRSENGSSLIYENYQLATQTTAKIVEGFKELEIFSGLSASFPEDKVSSYFEKLIYNDSFPLIRLLCIVRWYNRHQEGNYQHSIFWTESGYFPQLQNAWPDKSIKLVATRHILRIRPYVKRLYNWILYVWGRILSIRFNKNFYKESHIAIHNAEGIDLTRRSDLFWYPHSKLDKGKVVMYFDKHCTNNITEENKKIIVSMGIQCLCLGWIKGLPPLFWNSIWQPPVKKNKRMMNISPDKLGKTEKWLYETGNNMVSKIEFWEKFYRKFNIRVHYDIVEHDLENVAQNIALDVIGGIRFGKQRSETHGVVSGEYGQHHNHVFFSWNKRALSCLKNNRNNIDYCIISGFPYNSISQENKKNADNIRKRLSEKGVKFVIALYDNVFSDEALFSKNMMLSFYENFLKWTSDDADIGLIIKSKKPTVIERLPEIHRQLFHAKSAGRCIVMDNSFGRFPSDAAYAADMAIGIGISSSVTEAAIAGCKGIHCDLTKQYVHPFYQWGYNKVVFSNINKLVAALKRYKDHPENNPELGCWSSYLDNLDPFRDERGGERIGIYIRWLLESFDEGKSAEEAMQTANKLYADMWGADKIASIHSQPRL